MGVIIKTKVYGVGINDTGYATQKTVTDYSAKYSSGEYKRKVVWKCIFYQTWVDMLKRCYSKKHQESKPTYKGCTVSEEWLLFSNFRAWMVEQDWEGFQLEKDLLIRGNKIYSPETCVFVTSQVNNFILEGGRSRGEWPIGVYWDSANLKFKAVCRNPFTRKSEHLGRFSCEYEAHKAWLAKKLEHAYALAAIQTDPRVAKALIEIYESYPSYTKSEVYD